MVFTIKASGFLLKIEMVEIDELKLHEETIPSSLEKLADLIRSDGYLRHPVVVDEETRAVLDGMHRVEALRLLDCWFAPVCSVDYQDPRIKLGGWDRLFRKVEIKTVLDLCKKEGFRAEPCELQKAEETLAREERMCALISEEECYLLMNEEMGLQELYEAVKRIENVLERKNASIDYEVRGDVFQKVGSGGIGLLIPSASKEEVIDVALSSSVFVYKTTRHVVPARPMNVNVPIEWLYNGSRSLEEVNQELTESLKKRNIERLPPGSLFEGRRYEEELYVFENILSNESKTFEEC